jgi:small basic protein (TIGR04137 family)
MSLDRSLKVSANLAGKRSVLTRTERIAKMQADKKFDPKKDKVLGIPKTLVGKG